MSLNAVGRRVEVDRLVREGMPVLEHTLKLMSQRLGRIATMDEMRANAHRGLLEAARTFDPSRAALSTYVAKKIRWAILDGIKRERRSRRVVAKVAGMLASEMLSDGMESTYAETAMTVEAHESHLSRLLEAHAAAIALGLLVGDRECPSETDSPEAQIARQELCHKMRALLARLPERERTIVERHYFEGEAFEEIAEQIGISKSWVSRLHATAIERLASEMRVEQDG